MFYIQSQAAMKAHDFKSAKSFSDSAYHYLEDMYRIALQGKTAYYTSFLKKESERAKMQGKAEMQQWVFSLIVLLCFIVVIFILYIYKSYKHQIKLRMEHEREVLLQKQQMQEKNTPRGTFA